MIAAETVAARSEPLWGELLDCIESKRVIPIIGPAWSTLIIYGRAISLEAYVADGCHPCSICPPMPCRPMRPLTTLSRLICVGTAAASGSTGSFARSLMRPRLGSPPVLGQLAEIRQFNLYVTTAFIPYSKLRSTRGASTALLARRRSGAQQRVRDRNEQPHTHGADSLPSIR